MGRALQGGRGSKVGGIYGSGGRVVEMVKGGYSMQDAVKIYVRRGD